jgi:hypothetical protein
MERTIDTKFYNRDLYLELSITVPVLTVNVNRVKTVEMIEVTF